MNSSWHKIADFSFQEEIWQLWRLYYLEDREIPVGQYHVDITESKSAACKPASIHSNHIQNWLQYALLELTTGLLIGGHIFVYLIPHWLESSRSATIALAVINHFSFQVGKADIFWLARDEMHSYLGSTTYLAKPASSHKSSLASSSAFWLRARTKASNLNTTNVPRIVDWRRQDG